MRILAIINPVSGLGPKSRIPSMLAEAVRPTVHELLIAYTKSPGHGGEMAREAVEKGFEAIVAIGGDGTINEIASVVKNSPATLGIIPKGSGNGLARTLGIPMTVKDAIDVLIAGHVRQIDCCTINNRTFFCTCGVGFDAEVSDRFARARNRGPLQYIVSTIEEFQNYIPRKYTLTIDGQTFAGEAFLVAAANAPQYGNNAFIAPGASVDDGLMDVVIISPLNQIEGSVLALRLLTKKIGTSKKFDRYSARTLIIEREQEGMVHIDGEPVQMGRTLKIDVCPKSVRVFTPEPYGD